MKTLEVGKTYTMEPNYGDFPIIGKYLGVVELFKLYKRTHKKDYDKFHRDGPEKLLFDLGKRKGYYRYCLAWPQIRMSGNDIVISIKAESFTNNFTTAPMDDVVEKEYRLKEENEI
jgi:hypothetical protein